VVIGERNGDSRAVAAGGSKKSSWYSGLKCLGCGRRVVVRESRGLFRAVLDAKGRVTRGEAVCGNCRDRELRKAA
jgi:hypothetical protein